MDTKYYLYNIKEQVEVANRFVEFQVMSLLFVQCYLLCGTGNGKAFDMDNYNLNIEKCFNLQNESIVFVASSKDLNILVYSTESKSFLLNFEMKRIICSLSINIDAGVFLENKKQFAFLSGLDFYILNEYMKLVNIHCDFFGYHILRSTCSNYFFMP